MASPRLPNLNISGSKITEACGYPREQARWALSRCQGSPRARLNGALDLLLDGGEGGGGSGSGGGSAGTPVSPAKRPLRAGQPGAGLMLRRAGPKEG